MSDGVALADSLRLAAVAGLRAGAAASGAAAPGAAAGAAGAGCTPTPATSSRLSMPHERALARAAGPAGDDGRIPWAAWQVARRRAATRAAGLGLRSRPATGSVGTDHVAHGAIRRTCGSTPRESRALLGGDAAFFERGRHRAANTTRPTRWLAQRRAVSRPADRLARPRGRPHDRRWLPRAPEAAGPLRRLQQRNADAAVHRTRQRGARARAACCRSTRSGSAAAARCPRSTRPHAARDLQVDALPARRRPCATTGAAWAAAWQQLDAGAMRRPAAGAGAGERRHADPVRRAQRAALRRAGRRGLLRRRIGGLFSRHARSGPAARAL